MAAANSLQEKTQNLPLLCVETICKFTPTSKLIRLYSHVVPLPGAFWGLAVDSVLRKRLPFSIGPDILYHQADDPNAIFDNAGAKVAGIKQPKELRFASIAEFIESAVLTVRGTQSREIGGLQLFVSHGQALFSTPPKITQLCLVLREARWRSFKMKDLLEPNLKHLLPHLASFVIRFSSDVCNRTRLDQILVSFVKLLPFRDMSSLRRLDLPEDAFRHLSQAAVNKHASHDVQRILSGLSALGVSRGSGAFSRRRPEMLRFVAAYCRQVSSLVVVVCGEFKAYLDAFRAMTGLVTLGLDLASDTDTRFQGLAFDGRNVISSVLDLRVVYTPYANGTMLRISTFFPNVRAVAIQTGYTHDLLTLATFLFGERQLFPAVARLGCFWGDMFAWSSEQQLTQFLANPHLPDTVNLSSIIFKSLALDANLLSAIYCAMQGSSIKSLLLRGPVHRQALPRLQSHVDLNSEDAKVAAWKDRDLGDQPGILNLTEISEQTDVEILGRKTSGCLKDEQFTIRVFHQLAALVDIFD